MVRLISKFTDEEAEAYITLPLVTKLGTELTQKYRSLFRVSLAASHFYCSIESWELF